MNGYSSSKVTNEHLAKLAYIYVRQSSLSQVIRHSESTDLQYELVGRAAQFGWPSERVKVIDEDLGKSGASTDGRQGFQYLLAEIGLGKVGIVLSIDASRLSRNNADWYQLLELCSLFGALIADGESLYDPRVYADRLLLGLSGMMSEAELHQIKLRMHNGARHKAERGELRQALPVGLVRMRENEVLFHPDTEVQSRIRLVFEKFEELGTARAVVRYLHNQDLWLPSRPLLGPAPHDVIWQPARTSAVLGILRSPAYAGAYVYGQSRCDPTRRTPGHPTSGVVQVPIEDWPVVIQNIYPAYISWEQFLTNRKRLADNQSKYREDRPGAPRKGQALLQGIIRCGRCGAKMYLHYSGPQGEFPVYGCQYAHQQLQHGHCQEVRALGLDEEIERIVLACLAPDQIVLALAAVEQLEQENTTLRQQWQIRLERATYETERARRQYNAVEPENRLVARNLESLWEQKLRAKEQLEQDYQVWLRKNRLELTPEDRQEILALGENLPRVWYAPTTTPADRKQIVRLLIRDVVVDQHREKGKVWFQINWQTGAMSEHGYTRRVMGYKDYADTERLEQRIRELHAAEKMDEEIAATLNTEGFRTPHKQLFTSKLLWILRKQMGLPSVIHQGFTPDRWEDGTYSVEGAAKRIGVFKGTIYTWIYGGRLQAQQVGKGTPWKIPLDEEKITALQSHLEHVKRSKKKAV
ncbi:MAG TPA: recombinase family protein [Anaerolineaceae bacterium]|nr:recombinase family protein [Anaerolineaceae bacterium]